MSDMGRKGLGDQIGEKVKPNSQKSTLEQAQEGATGLYDRAAGAVQPEGNKSTTQKLGDATRSGSDDAESQGKGFVAQAQDTISNAAQTVSDTLSGNTNTNVKK
ncbi:chaperone/heat shock protein-like protein Hsp12 [Amniculicola lignicola CBS 123094]|uniref:Chaperone/heat shock protein-like protein Hsp12 n=1 Tax=Amniculicola lignicola CBS 123094 TaxID=1392246 RepID=A0A6A5WVQ3_9PLEO|nr:chaperone/heat shock protein-like protein Hsp12 [Amniculicola lignicola CBS 123094]